MYSSTPKSCVVVVLTLLGNPLAGRGCRFWSKLRAESGETQVRFSCLR